MRSLRARLMLGLILGTVVLLGISDLAIYHLVETAETAEFDDTLLSYARRISIIAEQELGEVTFEWEQVDPADTMRLDPNDSTGHLFVITGPRSGLVATNAQAFPALSVPARTGTTPRFRSVRLPDGTSARSASYAFPVRIDNNEPAGVDPEILTVTVFRRSVEIDDLLDRITGILVAVGLPVLVVGVAGTYLLLRFSFRGLAGVRQQLDTLADGDLSQQIDPGSLPSEFVPLIGSVNTLTDGLSRRIEREKRFVAAASHELRTPIATIQSNLELVRPPRSAGDDNDPVSRAWSVTRYMGQVVERLLTLNRLDHCEDEIECIALDLFDIVKDSLEPHADRLGSRGITVGIEPADQAPLIVNTDPVLLSLIVSNLLSNLAAYATEGSDARITIEVGDHNTILRVMNRTAPDNLAAPERLGEPFWRGDSVRNLQDRHVGLGLAIAKSASQRMGATLAFRTSGETFEAVLRLPT